MNWATKAREFVNDTRSMFFRPKHLSRFEYGAQWQREQLRTEEAHHRAARAIARMEPDEEWPDKTEHDAEYRHQCYDEAWDIITALLGEDK